MGQGKSLLFGTTFGRINSQKYSLAPTQLNGFGEKYYEQEAYTA